MVRPVLVLGAHPRTVVTIARSLHRRRIPVLVASFVSWQPCFPSRAIARFVQLPDYREAPQAFWEALCRLIATHQPDLLLPSSDEALRAIAPHDSALRKQLYLACPPPEIVCRVLSKAETMEAAMRCGVAVPVTYEANDLAALEGLRDRLSFPLLAKARDKEILSIAYLPPRYFCTYEALQAAFQADPQFGSRIVLQEYCAGDDVGIGVLMHRGEALTLFQYRALKTMPHAGGVSVLTFSEPVNPELAENAIRLLRELEWEGVAQVDFRHDPISGKAALLEINGRFWGSLAAATQAGVDFPYYVWQLAHGETPSVPAGYPSGLLARWAVGDFMRLLHLYGSERNGLPRPSRLQATAQFCWDFRPGVREMSWAWNDPIPTLMEAGKVLRKEAGSRLRALGRAGKRWQRPQPPAFDAPTEQPEKRPL
ncbi:MAG TPA: ATP-grasp domain-containing protein [Chthonomonadaceae bacterium]|nr:ATP-grasp domain-containing protein [Chthonomonadaceae bacterium]